MTYTETSDATACPRPTTIGAVLRRWRARAGLTQTQVAVLLEVQQTTISSWELERSMVSVPDLSRLAALYDVTASELGEEVRALTATAGA